MKKYLILLLLIYSNNIFAQFKLSGTIKNYNGHDELQINIPLVYSFDDPNSIVIPVAKNGFFSVSLPIKSLKFANVIYQQNFYLTLLNAGKSLKIELNPQTKTFKPIAGTALSENAVLQSVNVQEYPFFLKNQDAYLSLNPADLDNKLLKPYLAIRDKKIAAVNQSTISPKYKKLIAAELKYAVYNNLYELIPLAGQNANGLIKLVMDVFAKADARPEATPPGPQYYLFANYYLWYKEAKAAQVIKTRNLKPNQIIPEYGITVAEEDGLKAKYGDFYLRWLSATKFLPVQVVKELGYQYIDQAVKNHNALLAKTIAKEYLKKFPTGMYKKEINQKLTTLK